MSQLVQADAALLDHILDGTYEVWHDGLDRAAYARLWRGQVATPWGRLRLTRWALVDHGELLCGAKLYRYDAQLDGRAVTIAGIGAVFTPRPQRGHGYASELIDRLLDQCTRDRCDLAMLFSEIGVDFYARLGFETVPLSDLTLRVIEDERRGAPAMMVRSGEERDLHDIVAMDSARAAGRRLHLVRDRETVQFALARKRLQAGLGPAGARELQFFVAEEGASAVAYVVIDARAEQWTIDACGDRDPAGARLGGMLQVLIAREPSRQRPTITAWLPVDLRPPQIQVVDAQSAKDVMMIKPLTDRGKPAGSLVERDVVYWRGDAF